MSSCGVLGGLAIQRGVDACEYQERSRLRLAVLWSFVCRRASLDNTRYLRQCKKLCIHPIQRYHQFWSYPSSQRMSSKMRSGCIPVLASIVYFPQPRARVLAAISRLVQRPPPPRVLALALLTVARPRARPTPRPLVPLDRNMGAFLYSVSAFLVRRV